MKKSLIALSLVASAFVASAPVYAAAIVKEENATIRVHGKPMVIHMMKMDDGSTVYGLTRTQLEAIMQRRAESFFTSNPR